MFLNKFIRNVNEKIMYQYYMQIRVQLILMYNYLILFIMVHVNKLSEIKSAGAYEFNGAVINVAEITSSKKLKGICKLQDGTEFSFTNGASNLLYRIEHAGKCKPRTEAGRETSANILAKVDNSQAHGKHKVVAVSNNKLARQHRAVMNALNTINSILGYQDGANKLVQSAWYEYSNEQQAIAQRLKAQAEAEAKAKAEAEAKKQAEAEAKQQAKIAEAAELLIQQAMKNGLTREAAESSLKTLGLI